MISQIVLGGRKYNYRQENWSVRDIVTCLRCWACVWWVSRTVLAPTSLSQGSGHTAQGTHHWLWVGYLHGLLHRQLCISRRRRRQPVFRGRTPSCWLWWRLWHAWGVVILVLRPVCLFLFGRFSAWSVRWWDWETGVGAWSRRPSCWLPWWPVSLSWASTTGLRAPGAWISRCSVCVDVTEYLKRLGGGVRGVCCWSPLKVLHAVMLAAGLCMSPHPAPGLTARQLCSWVGEDPLVTS